MTVALGNLLSAKRPDLAVGPLLVALSVVPLTEFAISTWGSTDHRGAHTAAVLDAGVWMWFYAPAAILVAVFPDGRVPSRRWRWLLVGWPLVFLLFHLGVALDPTTYAAAGGRVSGAPPARIPSELSPILGFPALAGLLALLIGSVVAVVLRYRRGDPMLRTADEQPLRPVVRAADLPVLPAAVEVAAYRLVLEALTNVARHSGSDAAEAA